MKVLQLCKKFPYPLKDGESIAVTFLAKALHDLGCEVSLLARATRLPASKARNVGTKPIAPTVAETTVWLCHWHDTPQSMTWTSPNVPNMMFPGLRSR